MKGSPIHSPMLTLPPINLWSIPPRPVIAENHEPARRWQPPRTNAHRAPGAR